MPEGEVQPVVEWIAATLVTGFFAVWTTVLFRWRMGLPIVRYEPRRRVPWRAIDLAGVVCIYALLTSVVVGAMLLIVPETVAGSDGGEQADPSAAAADSERKYLPGPTDHSV